MTNPHSPHPADDDLDTMADLPEAVQVNAAHQRPPHDTDPAKLVALAILKQARAQLFEGLKLVQDATEALNG